MSCPKNTKLLDKHDTPGFIEYLFLKRMANFMGLKVAEQMWLRAILHALKWPKTVQRADVAVEV